MCGNGIFLTSASSTATSSAALRNLCKLDSQDLKHAAVVVVRPAQREEQTAEAATSLSASLCVCKVALLPTATEAFSEFFSLRINAGL
jgi:hypothetical protein